MGLFALSINNDIYFDVTFMVKEIVFPKKGYRISFLFKSYDFLSKLLQNAL